jgi:hypothetical protein
VGWLLFHPRLSYFSERYFLGDFSMTIPIVKTAIAPNGGMPAHPAPNARFFRHDNDYYLTNCNTHPVFSSFVNSLSFNASTSLIQIYTPEDVRFCTNIDPDFPDLDVALELNGMILKGGGYYSFSVDPGTTFFVKALTTDSSITILEA